MDIKEQARKRAEYHSERQRNREAVRDVIKRFQGDNVHKIDAFSVGSEEGRRTRTCGYCRVSTLDEEQGMSIQLQIDEYPRKIKVNPDLEFTGLYVDDGSSGTNVTGRNGFQLMMQDAYEGRFEQIFTKSVSRLARNIIDCLAYTEELKKLGINVFFLKRRA